MTLGAIGRSCSAATKSRMWDWDVSKIRIFWAWVSIEVGGLFVVICKHGPLYIRHTYVDDTRLRV